MFYGIYEYLLMKYQRIRYFFYSNEKKIEYFDIVII